MKFVRKIVGKILWKFKCWFNWKKIKIEENFSGVIFTNEELDRIQSLVAAHKNSDPWIRIDNLVFPNPGHIFRIKKGAQYKLTEAGSLVLVTTTAIIKDAWGQTGVEPTVQVFLLNQEGKLSSIERALPIRIIDLEEVPDEDELKAHWNDILQDTEPLTDGDPVELTEDVPWGQESQQGASAIKFTKGTGGVIDEPALQQGADLEDINSPYQYRKRREIHTVLVLFHHGAGLPLKMASCSIPIAAGGETYSVHIPDLMLTVRLAHSQVRKRSFDISLLDKVVMTDEIRQRILSLVGGRDELMKEWGIHKFPKGRGTVFLAYGPPGTGKTMTGEALAEYLGRPIYRVGSADLGWNSSGFEENFKRIIERTERWNSVTLIDEAEAILRSRDPKLFDSNARVEAVLRNLEWLKRGIIWFTTNRHFEIDFAIDSRVRAKICFPKFTAAERKAVWRISIPPEMPIEGLTEILEELSKINLNGREIRNAIINTAQIASYQNLSSIPAQLLLETALDIEKNQEALRQAREEKNVKDRPGQYL